MNLLIDTHAFIWFIEGSSELISQAIIEDFTVVTKDEYFPNYPIQIIW